MATWQIVSLPQSWLNLFFLVLTAVPPGIIENVLVERSGIGIALGGSRVRWICLQVLHVPETSMRRPNQARCKLYGLRPVLQQGLLFGKRALKVSLGTAGVIEAVIALTLIFLK